MLIVGSKALKHHFPNINREVNDIDIIGNDKDIKYLINSLSPKKVKSTEYVTTLIGINKNDVFDKSNVEILNYDRSESLRKYVDYTNQYNGLCYAPLEVIYSLKKSHIHFPIKFNKHINDYCLLNDYFGGIDKLEEITKLNFKETEIRIGKLKTPSLNKSVKEFFKQSDGYVKSYFIHDDIHLAVSHYDRPLYENMQNSLTMVKCDKNLWETFTFEDKCKCVLEEAYVISLERKILPFLFGGGNYYTSEEAFNWALMRICTTLCSGWFRSFATDNYQHIKNVKNNNYAEDFLQKYNDGNISRISQ
jgi:hypothetical protein